MKESRNYAVVGGEEIVITGEKHGRLMVKEGKLFFKDSGVIRPISVKDVLHIKIDDEWFGITFDENMHFQLDAKIYLPKKARYVA